MTLNFDIKDFFNNSIDMEMKKLFNFSFNDISSEKYNKHFLFFQ